MAPAEIDAVADKLPRCAAHPRSVASWYCTICQAPKCDACVQSTGVHGGTNATCLICGGRCIPLPGAAKSRQDAFRGGGVYDERDARSHHRREHLIAPIMLNVLLWLQFLLSWLRHQDPAEAALAVAVWPTVGTAAMLAAVWLIDSYLEAYFGPLITRTFKLAALVMLIHVLQLVVLGAIDKLLLLAPLIAFLLIPIVVLYVGLEYFFDLDPVELVASALGLFLMYNAVYFILTLNGVPV